MAQRVGILNGSNLNQDKDFGTLIDVLTDSTSFVVWSGLAVTTNSVAVGKALIKCTRTSTTPNETVWVVFENTSAVTIDTTGTKKVWIAIDQSRINDGTLNTDPTGAGIGAITTGASYPASNFIPLAVITGGSIVDDRPTATLKSHALSGILKQKKGVDIASATTTDLSLIGGNYGGITGTTTITSFGSNVTGNPWVVVDFLGIMTLTHNANIILPAGGANITTAVWDTAMFIYEGAGVWDCTFYQRADWSPLWTTPPSKVTRSSFIAGENLSVWDSVYINWVTDTWIVQNTGNGVYNASIKYSTTNESKWQSISFSGGIITNIAISLSRRWSPVGNLTLYIYSDTGTTLVATSSNTISEASVSAEATFTDYNFTFNNILSAWTYYLQLKTSRAANDTANNTCWQETTGSSYAGGQWYTINNTNTWTGGTYDMKFTITATTVWDFRAYKTDADFSLLCGFIWFVNTSATTGNSVSIDTTGVSDTKSGLTIGSTYYLSNTPWAISTSAGTISTKIWKAVSATGILIVHPPL